MDSFVSFVNDVAKSILWRLVAKKRGFCPFCCAKRVAETRAHLLENILPLLPYRHFVLSFPVPMRYWLHPFRQEIILKPEIRKGFQFGNEATSEDGGRAKVPNYSWAKMLAGVFKVDVTKCASCGGDLAKLAAVTDPMAARRYLKHAGIPG